MTIFFKALALMALIEVALVLLLFAIATVRDRRKSWWPGGRIR